MTAGSKVAQRPVKKGGNPPMSKSSNEQTNRASTKTVVKAYRQWGFLRSIDTTVRF